LQHESLSAVLVGCGGISKAWLGAIAGWDEVRIVGLVDIAPEAAATRAAEFDLQDAALGADLDAMLTKFKPDVLFNCTSPEAHLPTALVALAQGCHVLGEKPLADSMESARELIEAADRAGRICAVIQNRRYLYAVRRLRRFVESGALGPLTTVHSDFFIGAHFGGFRDHMEHVLLLDMAVHTFDAARLLTGADPVSVYCKEWNPSGSWYDRDASAVALFQMTGGLICTYRGSWAAEGLATSWEGEWRLIGPEGSVQWDGGDGFKAQVVAERGGFTSQFRNADVPPEDASDRVGGHAGVIADFLQCVRDGTRPETDAHDNIKSLAMVFGAVQSAAEGREVEVAW